MVGNTAFEDVFDVGLYVVFWGFAILGGNWEAVIFRHFAKTGYLSILEAPQDFLDFGLTGQLDLVAGNKDLFFQSVQCVDHFLFEIIGVFKNLSRLNGRQPGLEYGLDVFFRRVLAKLGFDLLL